MKIFSRFDRPVTTPEPKCPMDERRYVEKIDKNGRTYLVEGELVPFYQNIQKFKDECDVYKILSRYENGDPVAIQKLDGSRGQFGDFTDLPTDILDVKNKLNTAEQLFDSLPLEDRKFCDNNFNIFLSNLTKGILPPSLQKMFGIKTDESVSKSVEQKVNVASEESSSTIKDAINGNGGNL